MGYSYRTYIVHRVERAVFLALKPAYGVSKVLQGSPRVRIHQNLGVPVHSSTRAIGPRIPSGLWRIPGISAGYPIPWSINGSDLWWVPVSGGYPSGRSSKRGASKRVLDTGCVSGVR